MHPKVSIASPRHLKAGDDTINNLHPMFLKKKLYAAEELHHDQADGKLDEEEMDSIDSDNMDDVEERCGWLQEEYFYYGVKIICFCGWLILSIVAFLKINWFWAALMTIPSFVMQFLLVDRIQWFMNFKASGFKDYESFFKIFTVAELFCFRCLSNLGNPVCASKLKTVILNEMLEFHVDHPNIDEFMQFLVRRFPFSVNSECLYLKNRKEKIGLEDCGNCRAKSDKKTL